MEKPDGESALRRSRDRPSAFTEFYAVHARDVLAFFVRRTFDVDAARDLAAETFAQAFQHRARFRGTGGEQEAAWLYAIARHQLSRYVRRGVASRKAVRRLGIRVPPVHDDDRGRILELAGSADIRARVSAAFDELDEQQRLALKLRVIDELPYPQVATTLGVSEQTARARVSRALRALADRSDLAPHKEAA
ncbi:MAG TPA: RNA polymerase sigma factor [Solirubrobacteraceae bacterium]